MKSKMIQLGILVAVLTAAIVCVNAAFLAEKPAFFNPCKQTDPNFNRCLANNFEAVNREWKDGIPGLKAVPSIDPFHIKGISIIQDNNNALVQINFDLSNIDVIGMSNMKVEEASFDSDKLIAKFKYFSPKLHINAQYAMKGRILNLELNGNGNCAIEIGDSVTDIAMRLKRRDEHNLVFTDVDKLRLEITEIGRFHVQLDNLFNGNKELEDSANSLINENWQALDQVLRPAISNAIQTVMTSYFKRVFAYVPASYLVADLTTNNK